MQLAFPFCMCFMSARDYLSSPILFILRVCDTELLMLFPIVLTKLVIREFRLSQISKMISTRLSNIIKGAAQRSG
jgi:hypothetical protein